MNEKLELWDIKLPPTELDGLKKHADKMKAESGQKTNSAIIFRKILKVVYEKPEKLAGIVTQLIEESIHDKSST